MQSTTLLSLAAAALLAAIPWEPAMAAGMTGRELYAACSAFQAIRFEAKQSIDFDQAFEGGRCVGVIQTFDVAFIMGGAVFARKNGLPASGIVPGCYKPEKVTLGERVSVFMRFYEKNDKALSQDPAESVLWRALKDASPC